VSYGLIWGMGLHRTPNHNPWDKGHLHDLRVARPLPGAAGPPGRPGHSHRRTWRCLGDSPNHELFWIGSRIKGISSGCWKRNMLIWGLRLSAGGLLKVPMSAGGFLTVAIPICQNGLDSVSICNLCLVSYLNRSWEPLKMLGASWSRCSPGPVAHLEDILPL
jgi:hypothetical protein